MKGGIERPGTSADKMFASASASASASATAAAASPEVIDLPTFLEKFLSDPRSTSKFFDFLFVNARYFQLCKLILCSYGALDIEEANVPPALQSTFEQWDAQLGVNPWQLKFSDGIGEHNYILELCTFVLFLAAASVEDRTEFDAYVNTAEPELKIFLGTLLFLLKDIKEPIEDLASFIIASMFLESMDTALYELFENLLQITPSLAFTQWRIHNPSTRQAVNKIQFQLTTALAGISTSSFNAQWNLLVSMAHAKQGDSTLLLNFLHKMPTIRQVLSDTYSCGMILSRQFKAFSVALEAAKEASEAKMFGAHIEFIKLSVKRDTGETEFSRWLDSDVASCMKLRLFQVDLECTIAEVCRKHYGADDNPLRREQYREYFSIAILKSTACDLTELHSFVFKNIYYSGYFLDNALLLQFFKDNMHRISELHLAYRTFCLKEDQATQNDELDDRQYDTSAGIPAGIFEKLRAIRITPKPEAVPGLNPDSSATAARASEMTAGAGAAELQGAPPVPKPF